MNCVFYDVETAICVLSKLPAVFKSGVVSFAVIRRPFIEGKRFLLTDNVALDMFFSSTSIFP
jgi:hypothetical protein